MAVRRDAGGARRPTRVGSPPHEPSRARPRPGRARHRRLVGHRRRSSPGSSPRSATSWSSSRGAPSASSSSPTALSAEHGVEALAVPADLTDAEQRARAHRVRPARRRSSSPACATTPASAPTGASPRPTRRTRRRWSQLNVAAVHELTLAFLRADGRAPRGRDPQRRLARRLPAGAGHGHLRGDEGVRAVVLRGAARRARRHAACRAPCSRPARCRPSSARSRGPTGVESLVARLRLARRPRRSRPPRCAGCSAGRRSVVPGAATKALATGGRYVPRSILLPVARRARRAAATRADASYAASAAASSSPGDAVGRVAGAAEQPPRELRAAEVQRRVVLPGRADAAVHGDHRARGVVERARRRPSARRSPRAGTRPGASSRAQPA